MQSKTVRASRASRESAGLDKCASRKGHLIVINLLIENWFKNNIGIYIKSTFQNTEHNEGYIT